MKLFCFFVISFFISLFTTIKAQECVVLTSSGFPQIPESTYGDPHILEDFSPTQVRTVYIAAHIVRSSSGQGGISTNDLNDAISDLNSAYSNVMIQFVHDQTDYIDNDLYYTVSEQNFPALAQINLAANKLNVYFCPQGSGINGIAYLANNKCAVTNAAAINGSTLAHEIGHNFYLYHTHGNGAQEYVNGSNCTTAGDYLCDTPAEPYNDGNGISGYVYSNTCNYFGTFRDPNNELFMPDTHNFLGYSTANCRDSFTELQIQKMNQTLTTILSYLINVQVPLANKINDNVIPDEPNKPSTLTVIGGQTVNSGNNANLLDGNSYDIRTNQERFPSYSSYGNIKHNNWNGESSEFLLTENYTVNRSESPHRDANFLDLNFGRIELKLEGQVIENKGEGKFQDPWYVLSNGNQPGDYWIDFNSYYEPTGKEGALEKGVFLDQGTDWQPPYYSVQAISPQIIPLGGKYGSRTFYFKGWTGSGLQYQHSDEATTPVVFTSSDATATAIMKGHLLSDKTTAFASNGQRNLIRDKNSIYHIFYISMFKIWHTHSLTSNFNGSWTQEEEVPLYYGCYHPVTLSVDYDGDNQIVLAYVGEDAVLDYTVINLDGSLDRTHSFSSNYIDYDYLNSVLPVVSFSPNQIMIVYKPAANVGLYYARSYKITNDPWQYDEGIIPHTDMTSLNPSIASNKTNTDFYLAFQQGNALYTSINYCQVSPNLPLNFDISTISIPSGYNQNYSPSINLYRSSYSGYRPMVSWTAKNIGTLGKKSNTTGAQIPEPRMVCRNQDNLGTWGDFFVAGQSVNYSYNNSVISTTYGQSVIAWSQLDGTEVKWVRRDPSKPSGFSNTTCLEPAGLIPNITTGTNYSTVKAFTCDGSSLPAILNPAVTDFSQTPVCGGQQKITLPYDLTYSRSGVLSKDIIEFVFNTGDIINGDSVINFINVPDTLQYHSAGELNSSLLTGNFILNQNSDLSFTNYYYVINTEASDSLLSETDAINFKVELVSASTNQVIGTFDNITFTKENLDNYENISYRVDCTGITEGEYFMRIVTSVTGDVNYNLINTQNDASVVAKRTYNDVGYTGQEIPVIYDLSQNFPNPYNPTTTINYQLPQNGFVTLKVYDILGKEVATLVNEQKNQGRYSVNFDASRLASGVYIYQIRVNDYVSSKKMLLLK